MLSESLMSTALYAQRSRQLSDAGEPRSTLTLLQSVVVCRLPYGRPCSAAVFREFECHVVVGHGIFLVGVKLVEGRECHRVSACRHVEARSGQIACAVERHRSVGGVVALDGIIRRLPSVSGPSGRRTSVLKALESVSVGQRHLCCEHLYLQVAAGGVQRHVAALRSGERGGVAELEVERCVSVKVYYSWVDCRANALRVVDACDFQAALALRF